METAKIKGGIEYAVVIGRPSKYGSPVRATVVKILTEKFDSYPYSERDAFDARVKLSFPEVRSYARPGSAHVVVKNDNGTYLVSVKCVRDTWSNYDLANAKAREAREAQLAGIKDREARVERLERIIQVDLGFQDARVRVGSPSTVVVTLEVLEALVENAYEGIV